MENHETLLLITTMCDYYRTRLTEMQVEILKQDFSRYPAKLLVVAWSRYRQKDTHNKMPTIAQLLDNFDDGRPSAHDAWAMIPRDEDGSTFWTDEMRESYGIVYQTMNSEKANAWFAFKEKYEGKVRENRMLGVPVKWSPSFGRNVAGRAGAIKHAVEKGYIALEWAKQKFPELAEGINFDQNLIEGKEKARISQVLKIAQKKEKE